MRRRFVRSQRGQVLIIVAGGLVVIVSMVGLVIDGGQAWVRQRDTQNGADAVAKAGTIQIQHYLAGDLPAPTDLDVACAVAGAAASNGVAVDSAVYTDFQGVPLGFVVGSCTANPGGAIPTGAQGVRATASETFETLLMSVIGVDQLTAVADATAVVGNIEGIPGGALPVTFPESSSVCDSLDTPFTIKMDDGVLPWEPYEIIDEADADSTNLAIVPLCDVAPGSVGWLDWGCGQNLSDAISDPCEVFIPIPAWVHTQTGNVNALEDEINAYAGSTVGLAEADDSVVALPIHDFTCDQDIPDPDPTSTCPSFVTWSGNGNNLYYHIRYWIGFKVDAAYTQGSDVECQSSPGGPVLVAPEPPGKVGCLKGWFVNYFDVGPVGIAPITPGGSDSPLAVTLIN